MLEHDAHDIICIGPRVDGPHHVMMMWADGELCSVRLEWLGSLGIWTCKTARVVGLMAGHGDCLMNVLELAITVPGVGPLGPEAKVWWGRQTSLTDLKLQRIRVAKAECDGREIARICGRVVTDETQALDVAWKAGS